MEQQSLMPPQLISPKWQSCQSGLPTGSFIGASRALDISKATISRKLALNWKQTCSKTPAAHHWKVNLTEGASL